MPQFSALVVDDEEYVRLAAESQLRDLCEQGRVHLHTCKDAPEAYDAIDARPWDLAFVDLNLKQNFETGRAVLQRLAERAPLCERVAMTQHLDHDTHRWIDLVSPADAGSDSPEGRLPRIVDGVIAKSLDSNWFARVTQARLQNAVHADSVFSGIVELAESLELRTYPRSRRDLSLGSEFRTDPAAIALEVERLLWRLFSRVRGIERPLEVRLTSLNQGLSAAVTVAGEVRLDTSGADARWGSRTVLKFGPRASIEREVARYANVVRYGVPLDSRVELLDWASGDGLAVLAYSFAGGGVRKIFSLDDCGRSFLDPAPAVDPPGGWCTKAIERLFDADEARWYRVEGQQTVPRHYFDKELHVKFERAIETMSNRVETIVKRELGSVVKDELVIGTVRLRLPRMDFLGTGVFVLPMRTCLTHGDFHGGNVLMDLPERAALIDFAHSGFGPLAVDAAVLNGSIRLWDSQLVPDPADAEEIHGFLRSRLTGEMKLAAGDRSVESRRRPIEPWQLAAATLDRCNEGIFGDFAPLDRLVPYCLHAVRMLGFDFGDRRLNYAVLFRLLCWYTAIHQEITRLPAPSSTGDSHKRTRGRR